MNERTEQAKKTYIASCNKIILLGSEPGIGIPITKEESEEARNAVTSPCSEEEKMEFGEELFKALSSVLAGSVDINKVLSKIKTKKEWNSKFGSGGFSDNSSYLGSIKMMLSVFSLFSSSCLVACENEDFDPKSNEFISDPNLEVKYEITRIISSIILICFSKKLNQEEKLKYLNDVAKKVISPLNDSFDSDEDIEETLNYIEDGFNYFKSEGRPWDGTDKITEKRLNKINIEDFLKDLL